MRILLLLLISLKVTSQVKKADTVYCDCHEAKTHSISSVYTTGVIMAPEGPGKVKEISPGKQKTRFAFEKEHNSAWYKLQIAISGEMTFNIIPVKGDDDYDFMLFKAGKNNFCDSLKKYAISPIRACISRDKEELKGRTGLDFKSENELVKQGVGPAYCKALPVKKGEVYYLVLDNVYDHGGKHTIEFEIAQRITLKGTVTDENNEPVKAEIAVTNVKGDTVLIENTKDDGSYDFTVPIAKYRAYDLHFYNENSFSFTKSFFLVDTTQLKSLKMVLPKLKKGSKYSVGAINFIGGSVQYLSRSIPSMHNLARLLKKNPGLRIKIIGHSNGRQEMNEQGILKFTKDRANSIKGYLIKQGIDETRIEIDGKGDHEMLFKLPKATWDQQEENRRVEVMVLDF